MFDGYRDAELVGEGGLGRLYRAIRISTGGPVAIKELRDVSSASVLLHRAQRELEALLKLKGHPYVVSVEEIIEGPLGPCIVMEYAPGGSLHDRVAYGPLSTPEVVLVGQHVTQALGAAHEQGIVHRDVKPHNLLIGSFGQIKVCDFGIAALFRGPSGRTQTQALTLAYASPEELDGDGDVGPPADSYSFAATMVHLITGRRPTFRERLAGSGREVSLTTGDLDPALIPIIGALRFGLAHDPEDRPHMDEFAHVFDTAASNLGERKIQRLSPTRPPVATGSGAASWGQPAGPMVDPDLTDHRRASAGTAFPPGIIDSVPSIAAAAGGVAATHPPLEAPLDPSTVTVDDNATIVRKPTTAAIAVDPVDPAGTDANRKQKGIRILAASALGVAAIAAVWLGVVHNAGAEHKAADTAPPTITATTIAPSTTPEPSTSTTTGTTTTLAPASTTTLSPATSIVIVLPVVPETTTAPTTTRTATTVSKPITGVTSPPTAAPTTAAPTPTSPPPTQPPPTTPPTTPPPNYPTGDVNKDCVVNQTDINIVQSDIGTSNRRSDLNGDGIVSSTDVTIANSHRGEMC